MATFIAEIEVTVDEFLDELDHVDKEELFKQLAEELNKDEEIIKMEHDVKANKTALMIAYFRSLSDFDKRKFLCDALYVPNYYDNDALRDTLAPIINAR